MISKMVRKTDMQINAYIYLNFRYSDMQFTIRAFLYVYISLTFVVIEENKKEMF